jgi:hypothetical protein
MNSGTIEEIEEEKDVDAISKYHLFEEEEDYISDHSKEDLPLPDKEYEDDFEPTTPREVEPLTPREVEPLTPRRKTLKKGVNYMTPTKSWLHRLMPSSPRIGGKTRRRKRKSVRKMDCVVFSFLPRSPRPITKKRRRNRKTRKGKGKRK